MMSDDELDRVTDQIYAYSVEHSTAAALRKCPRLAPLPAQVRILDEVMAWATRRGCRLPQFTVCWRAGPRHRLCAGAVRWDQQERFWLYLDATAYPEELRSTVAHELMHLHDLASGREFSRVALERRATEFAARLGRKDFHVDEICSAREAPVSTEEDDSELERTNVRRRDQAGDTRRTRTTARSAAAVELLPTAAEAPWLHDSRFTSMNRPAMHSREALGSLLQDVAQRRRRAIENIGRHPVLSKLDDRVRAVLEQFVAIEFSRIERGIEGQLMTMNTPPW